MIQTGKIFIAPFIHSYKSPRCIDDTKYKKKDLPLLTHVCFLQCCKNWLALVIYTYISVSYNLSSSVYPVWFKPSFFSHSSRFDRYRYEVILWRYSTKASDIDVFSRTFYVQKYLFDNVIDEIYFTIKSNNTKNIGFKYLTNQYVTIT